MRSERADNPAPRRLRVVFEDTVRSSNVGRDASLQDVAEALDALAMGRYGRPVAIELSFPVRSHPPAAASGSPQVRSS